MLGRNHALLGIAGYAGAVWAGVHGLHLPPLSAEQAVLGVAVAAGAALLPDLDESHSLSGRANPLSHLPIFGGHRTRTHTLLAVLGVTVMAAVCQWDQTATAVLVGVCCVGGGPVLSRRLASAGPWLCVPWGVGLGYVAYTYVTPGWWLVAAVGVPYLSHLLGDGMTPHGVPLLMPWSKACPSLHLFRTGKKVETLVVHPILILLTAAAGFEAFSPTALTLAHGWTAVLR